MQTRRLAVAMLLALLPLVALAQGSGWRDPQGNAMPETESARSSQGFSATLVATPDKDWREKWDTPPETLPHFTQADTVETGGELFLLTFLANPKVDAATGKTDVTCDFRVTRPDGTTSIDQHDLPCFRVELKSDPRNVFLSGATLKYVAEPADLRGVWVTEVTVRDNLRGVSLPLRTSFTVK